MSRSQITHHAEQVNQASLHRVVQLGCIAGFSLVAYAIRPPQTAPELATELEKAYTQLLFPQKRYCMRQSKRWKHKRTTKNRKHSTT